MPLQKQNASINFSKGLETKSDPKQIPPGTFLSIKNTIFSDTGKLTKRAGFKELPSLPDSTSKMATTFNGNLLAIGDKVEAFSQGAGAWYSKGAFNAASLSTLPLIRSSLNQSQCDTAISSNGLTCVVYTDNPPSGVQYKYAIADTETGQNVIAPTLIPVSSGVVTGSPRVFTVGNYFFIVFNNVITGTNHLQFVAINSSLPTSITTNADISASYTPSSNVAFDGFVINNNLYLAWNGADGGNAIRMTYISSTLTQANTVIFAGRKATHMSVCADNTLSTSVIYANFYDSGTSDGYALAVNQALVTVLAPVHIITGKTVANITSSAMNGVDFVYYEITNAYGYDAGVPTNFISALTMTQAGSVTSDAVFARSVGLASKSFILNNVIYVMGAYSSAYQPSYFLFNQSKQIISTLAYSNGSGYLTKGLPSVNVDGALASVSYLIKDLISGINKAQGAAVSAGVYSQTGVNICAFEIGADAVSSEIGNNLNLTGGFLWMYDGYSLVENNFFVWPDSVEVTTAATGGLITAQQYFYVATYEWADNQGNVFRSAPSIPVSVTTTGSTSANTIHIPTLRLTYKTANPVTIVVYRWSAAQQTYYRVTSLTSPVINDVTADSVDFVDIKADSAIIGNNILYTTGGVIENIAPPAAVDVSLFKSRLFLVDAEDRNLLWYSKQVIEGTPVEMSDLFTIYVAPTTGAQGSTGRINFTAPLDDKLIIFKDNALYYITGTGPDNTGANNDFSEPIFITATVGSDNKNSVVFIPQGLLFQSDKGIWLLGRDLNTIYLGANVQLFNNDRVVSAINIPGTNQVRFALASGITLMYDYFEGQWGEYAGISQISSTLYEGLHTFINASGKVFQENPGSYLDGANPVLMSFTTGWYNIAGLQGYERAYAFYLLAEFYSPHKLQVQIAYDYAPSAAQSVLITPDNYSAPWGGDESWGQSSPWGGTPSLEQWRVFFQNQRCQAFQITVTEVYDSSFGPIDGAGFSLSGMNLVYGVKKGYTPIKAKNTAGVS